MKVKPRIRRWCGKDWICEGSRAHGLGHTPKQAYDSWVIARYFLPLDTA